MSTARIDFQNRDDWLGGPLCEVQVSFQRTPSARELDRIVASLGIEHTYASIKDIKSGRTRPYSQCDGRARGIWTFGRGRSVGTLIISSRRASVPMLELCIPPRHMSIVFPEFPWQVRGWRSSRETIRFHILVLNRVRRLNDIVPLRGILIQDEIMLRSLKRGVTGLFVIPEVAAHFKWRGNAGDFLTRVDLGVLGLDS